MFNFIRARMEQLRNTSGSARREARMALRRAELWGTIAPPSEELAEAITITAKLVLDYPKTLQLETDLRRRMSEIQKEQALKTCMECERLLSLCYLQKTRLEGQASNDNWARDALGPVSRNIQRLEELHRELRMMQESPYY